MAPSYPSSLLTFETSYIRTLLPRIPEAAEEHQPDKQNRQRGKHTRAKNRLTRKNKVSGCYIPKCRLQNCNLMTHRHPPWLRDDNANDKQAPMSFTDLECALDVIPHIPDSALQDGEIRELFHQFISYDIPLLAAYSVPPSLAPNPRRIIQEWQIERLALGLSEPLFVLCTVALAHMHRLVRRGELGPAHISSQIYGCLIRLLREKVENCVNTDAGKLIMALPVLVMFDLALGHSQAIENHRAALKKLVHHGATSNAGRTIDTQSIPAFDLITSTATGKAPSFVPKPDRSFHLPWRSRVYGLALELPETRLALDLDFEVAEICEDICRAIEMVEVEQWTFMPSRFSKPYNGSNVQYMFLIRNHITQYLPHLQAKDLRHSPKSKAIFLASTLVNYIVLHINYMPFWTIGVANQLLEELLSPNLNKVWKGHEDILCWLMCTLAVTPRVWDKRPKALQLFRKWLKPRICNSASSEDCNDLLSGICNLQDFVWCSSQLDKPLSHALKDMGALFRTSPTLEITSGLDANIWQGLVDVDGMNEADGMDGIIA